MEDGENIEVNDDNKDAYIFLRSEFETQLGFEGQLNSFLRGFYSVIPIHIISILEPEELELLLCGTDHIDIKQWMKYTVYSGVYNESHKVVRWFWEVVRTLNSEMQSRLLEFVTGSPRLPIQGFKVLQTMRGDKALFKIESINYGETCRLPRSHTCFNRLDLPIYPSKKTLEESLKYVIENHYQGFGME